MTPFTLILAPGQSIVDQVVFAATKAFVTGAMRPGDPFPSVRALAMDLKVHPNTIHKAVQHLIQERWLEVKPGVGTVVAQPPQARAGDRQRLLGKEIETLVVEAKRVGLDLGEVIEAIEAEWTSMDANRKGPDQ